MERARDLIALGDYEGAMGEYERLERRSPGDERALCGKALVFISRYDLDGALRCMARVVSGRPDAGYAHGMAGAILHELDRGEQALECCEAMLYFDPGEISAYVKKAQILSGMGREKECRDAIDECLGAAWSGRESPKEVRRLRLMKGRMDGGGPEFAYADGETFVPGMWELLDAALGPGGWGDGDEPDLEGAVRAGIADFEACMECLDGLAGRFPGAVAPLCMKGMLLSGEDRADEAAACYDAAIRISPGEMLAYSSKCDLLADAGDLAGVVECLGEAAGAEPADAENARMQEEMRDLLGSLERGGQYPDSEPFAGMAATAKWMAGRRSGLDAAAMANAALELIRGAAGAREGAPPGGSRFPPGLIGGPGRGPRVGEAPARGARGTGKRSGAAGRGRSRMRPGRRR